MKPTLAKPIKLPSSGNMPECTNSDVIRRHHSPFVVRGPTLPPHAISVAGSLSVPSPTPIRMKTAIFSARIKGTTTAKRVRSRSACANASQFGGTLRICTRAVWTAVRVLATVSFRNCTRCSEFSPRRYRARPASARMTMAATPFEHRQNAYQRGHFKAAVSPR
jgi:hypothetical protein